MAWSTILKGLISGLLTTAMAWFCLPSMLRLLLVQVRFGAGPAGCLRCSGCLQQLKAAQLQPEPDFLQPEPDQIK